MSYMDMISQDFIYILGGVCVIPAFISFRNPLKSQSQAFSYRKIIVSFICIVLSSSQMVLINLANESISSRFVTGSQLELLISMPMKQKPCKLHRSSIHLEFSRCISSSYTSIYTAVFTGNQGVRLTQAPSVEYKEQHLTPGTDF